MAEWFRALDLNSSGLWLKSSTLLLSGFVLGSLEFNSSTSLCKPIGQPPTSWAYGRQRGRVVKGAGFEIWGSLVEIPPPFCYLDLFSVVPSSTPRLTGQPPTIWDSQ